MRIEAYERSVVEGEQSLKTLPVPSNKNKTEKKRIRLTKTAALCQGSEQDKHAGNNTSTEKPIEKPKKKRIGYLDAARGFAILCIVLGHTGLSYMAGRDVGGMPFDLIRFIYTFHVPLFLLISGYLMANLKPISFHGLRHSARCLLLPYAIACGIIILISSFRAYMLTSGDMIMVQMTAQHWLEASFWCFGAVDNLVPGIDRIGGLWFLPALFWSKLLMQAISRLDEGARAAIALSATALAALSMPFIVLPLGIQAGMSCMAFVWFGSVCAKAKLFDKGAIHPLVWAALAGVWIYSIVFGGRMAVCMSTYPMGLADVIGGIAGSLIVLLAFRKAEELSKYAVSWLEPLGKITLAILCIHIIEDDLLRWEDIGQQICWSWFGGADWCWIVIFALRAAAYIAIAGIIYWCAPLRWIFMPNVRKVKEHASQRAAKRLQKTTHVHVPAEPSNSVPIGNNAAEQQVENRGNITIIRDGKTAAAY